MCENSPSVVSNYPHGETLNIPTLITGSCRLITIFCFMCNHYMSDPYILLFGLKLTLLAIWVELTYDLACLITYRRFSADDRFSP